jgi:hypothetical protein
MNYTSNNLFALYCASSIPQQAFSLDASLSIDEYYVLAQTDEFKKYCDEYTKFFADAYEGSVIYRIHSLQNILNGLEKQKDFKFYASLQRELTSLYKITSPLLEKLARISKETQTFTDLEIVIE